MSRRDELDELLMKTNAYNLYFSTPAFKRLNCERQLDMISQMRDMYGYMAWITRRLSEEML